MSSAFLYVGIVAIWAFVLVPRWLRRPAPPRARNWQEEQYSDEAGAQARHDTPPASDDAGDEHADETYAPDYRGDDDYPGRDDYSGRDGYAGPASHPAWNHQAAWSAGQVLSSRSRIIRARRRLLTMLVLLTAAAGLCTALKLTSWWACVPPAGMLGFYLLLLREAALADAEHARWRAAAGLRDQAARQYAYAEWEEQQEPEHSAEVIDISDRVGDQLYDQYADATVRAVGD